MKRHCGRPIGGRGEGYAKSGQMRTRGREGVKMVLLCGRPLWMAPCHQCHDGDLNSVFYSQSLKLVFSFHETKLQLHCKIHPLQIGIEKANYLPNMLYI